MLLDAPFWMYWVFKETDFNNLGIFCQIKESSYLRNIMPIREIVAGDAELKSCVSNRKFTLGPNCIRSPDGIVSKRLSSKTEFSDSIHSGSMSPSHMIHDCMFNGSRTTRRAALVRTPSDHSRVSMSICPKSWKWKKMERIFTDSYANLRL